MARTSTRTPAEIAQLLKGYKESGLPRRQYCEKQGIAVTTFDYYRQRQRKEPGGQQKTSALVRVKLTADAPLPQHPVHLEGFTVTLAKGRRIESSWSFNERDLARLIRVLEAA